MMTRSFSIPHPNSDRQQSDITQSDEPYSPFDPFTGSQSLRLAKSESFCDSNLLEFLQDVYTSKQLSR